MRTEVKIGLVVGLVVVAGAIIFFVNQSRKAGSTVTEALPVSAPADRVATGSKQSAPPRSGPTDRPFAGGQRPGTRPPAATPITAPKPAEPRAPTKAEETLSIPPLTQVSPAERAPTTQPAVFPELPPLVTREEPVTRPAGPEDLAAGLAPRTPGVSPPPRKEPEPAAVIPPPSPAAGREAAAGPTKHTIAGGDSLWSLAEQYYGDGNLWPRIKAANPGIDEHGLAVGQVVVIPPKEPVAADQAKRTALERPAVKPAAPAPETRPAARPHTYRVEEGDSLISIARNILKDENRWKEIFELNRDKISNPDILRVGIELKLPEK
jgi:nucleoid-associated protein YgaU